MMCRENYQLLRYAPRDFRLVCLAVHEPFTLAFQPVKKTDHRDGVGFINFAIGQLFYASDFKLGVWSLDNVAPIQEFGEQFLPPPLKFLSRILKSSFPQRFFGILSVLC